MFVSVRAVTSPSCVCSISPCFAVRCYALANHRVHAALTVNHWNVFVTIYFCFDILTLRRRFAHCLGTHFACLWPISACLFRDDWMHISQLSARRRNTCVNMYTHILRQAPWHFIRHVSQTCCVVTNTPYCGSTQSSAIAW